MRSLFHALPGFADLLSLVMLTGITVNLAHVLPNAETINSADTTDSADLEKIRQSLFRQAVFAIALSFVAGLFVFIQKTMSMSAQDLNGAIALLPIVLSDTHYGSIWLIWLCTLSMLGLAAWACNRRQTFRSFTGLACVGVSIIAWTHSASGHAADGGDFTLGQWLDWLHILAGSAWLGGVSIFALAIAPTLRDEPEGDRIFLMLLKRLSRLAMLSFAIVLATGLYNFRQRIGTPALLLQGRYAVILTFKLALVSGMLLTAMLTRLCGTPRFRSDSIAWRNGKKGTRGENATRALAADEVRLLTTVKKLMVLETTLGIGVIYLVAILIREMPLA